jgi:hypothetical protein
MILDIVLPAVAATKPQPNFYELAASLIARFSLSRPLALQSPVPIFVAAPAIEGMEF